MPVLCEFRGIKIALYPEYGERHKEPHFHAYYGEHRAVFSIVSLTMIACTGNFPLRIEAEIREWAYEHRRQLILNGA
jgi:hypothetical protein